MNIGRQGWARGCRSGDDLGVTVADDPVRAQLLRRGFMLEYATLGWNAAGIIVLAVTAVAARSVALAGFGLDSLIEIGASTVVIWELSGTGEDRQRRGLRLIGYAFTGLAAYLRPVDRRAGGRVPSPAFPRGDRVDGGHRGSDVRAGGREGPDRARAGQPGAAH